MDYETFLRSKAVVDSPTGISSAVEINPALFDFQQSIVRWAIRRGRAAIFSDCGTGKTAMQLEWSRHVCAEAGGNILILAPLAVAQQTVTEGSKFGISVTHCRTQGDVKPGINVTNYEMLHHFDCSEFVGVVLDESSILKAYDGKFRTRIIESFARTPFKLACTATPAPNDYMELGNHAEFLGVMSRTEMLSMFFVHDGGETQKWRLKGHAESEFWKWLCSWAVNLRKPADLGFNDGGFTLPPLEIKQHIVDANSQSAGLLFTLPASTLQERRDARRSSLDERVRVASEIANSTDGPVLVWCDLNCESDALTKAIPGAVEVKGSDSVEHKEASLRGFSAGEIRVLVTKPSIAGHGLNWQHCDTMVFVGLSDSYEEYYQAVRRCWRFGQKKPVTAHIVISTLEGAVAANIARKEKDAERMASAMVEHMASISSEEIRGVRREKSEYKRTVATGKGWTLHLGDCVDVVKEIEPESIHFSIFSPPFSSLYTYSNSDRDMGNCRDDREFMRHFRFLVEQLFRVTIPGRLCSVHCMDIPTMKSRGGVIGLKDFPGEIIREFESAGFIYHSKVVIWKDPLIEATRTKALGLMHKQIIKDSAMCRQGLPDYLLTMRKPGDNPEPIRHPNGFETFIGLHEPHAPKREPRVRSKDIESYAATTSEDPVYSHQVWRRYASAVWMDIDQTNTLQRESAREAKDEKHICPLQLDVIERSLALWSNPGDLVLSPFAGIGSEGHAALKMGRRFVGVELKESYWKQARLNLIAAESLREQELFKQEEVAA